MWGLAASHGAIFLAGGRGGESSVGDGVFYDGRWAAKFATNGELEWEFFEPLGEEASMDLFHTIAVTAEGETHLGRGGVVQRIDGRGQANGVYAIGEATEAVAALPGGDLVWGGSHVDDFQGGRPTARAVITRRDRDGNVLWAHLQGGRTDGYSGVVDLAVNGEGSIIAGGYLGASDQSNASDSWVMLLAADGTPRWSVTDETGPESHRSVAGVGATPDNGAVAVGFGDGPWFRRWSATGEQLWTRSAPGGLTSAAGLGDGGVLVASIEDRGNVGSSPLTVRAFDPSGEERWTSVYRTDCVQTPLTASGPDGGAVVVARCGGGTSVLVY